MIILICFFLDLAIEKLLKALHVVKQKDHAPPIHNLIRLAKLAGKAVPEDKIDALIEIHNSASLCSL